MTPFNIEKFIKYMRKGLYKEYFCEETGNSEELYNEDYVKIKYLVPKALVCLQIVHKDRFAHYLCQQILFKTYISKVDEANCILSNAAICDYEFDKYDNYELVTNATIQSANPHNVDELIALLPTNTDDLQIIITR